MNDGPLLEVKSKPESQSQSTDEQLEEVTAKVSKFAVSNYRSLEDLFNHESGSSTSTDYDGMDEDPVDFYSAPGSPASSPSLTPLTTPDTTPEVLRKKTTTESSRPMVSNESRSLSWTNLRGKLLRKNSKDDLPKVNEPDSQTSPQRRRKFRRGTK